MINVCVSFRQISPYLYDCFREHFVSFAVSGWTVLRGSMLRLVSEPCQTPVIDLIKLNPFCCHFYLFFINLYEIKRWNIIIKQIITRNVPASLVKIFYITLLKFFFYLYYIKLYATKQEHLRNNCILDNDHNDHT